MKNKKLLKLRRQIKEFFTFSNKKKAKVLHFVERLLKYQSTLKMDDLKPVTVNLFFTVTEIKKLKTADLNTKIFEALAKEMLRSKMIEVHAGLDECLGNHVVKATAWFLPRKDVPERLKIDHYSLENQRTQINPGYEKENNTRKIDKIR